MNVISDLLRDVSLPDFYRMKYHLDDDHIEKDRIAESVKEALKTPGTLDRITPGSAVCLTCGSREIQHIALITKTIVDEIKSVGGNPFIIPAMGSHGGATAEGQRHILEMYGVTEEAMGCPIVSSMETKIIGKTVRNHDVPMSVDALVADFIVPVGRIKGHTDIQGPIESGLQKMMAIGLGKREGAEACHNLGLSNMSQTIQEFATVIMEKCKIPFAFGIIENACHNTYGLYAVPVEDIPEKEKELLELAKSLMPKVPFEKVDVCIVEQFGKDISGDGMDPTVLGRNMFGGRFKPYIDRIGVLDFSAKGGRNFNGMSNADVIPKKLFDKMSFEETYPNVITASSPYSAKIPIVMPTDLDCIKLCIRSTERDNRNAPIKMVWLKDTLHLNEFIISEGLYEEAMACADMTILSHKLVAQFDENEAYIGFEEKKE